MPTSSKTTTTASTSYDPAAQDAYFRETHSTRPYVVSSMDYETDYLPAYRYGLAVSEEHAGKTYETVESHVKTGWDKAKGQSRLSWDQANHAVRDAFDRTIQLREEQLHVDKERVSAGQVNLSKQVKTEHKSMTVPVESEEVTIERRVVNKRGDAADIGEESFSVPVTKETVRVSKDTVVTEEVSIGKHKVAGTETVAADLKREELIVETEGNAKVKQTSADKTDKKSGH